MLNQLPSVGPSITHWTPRKPALQPVQAGPGSASGVVAPAADSFRSEAPGEPPLLQRAPSALPSPLSATSSTTLGQLQPTAAVESPPASPSLQQLREKLLAVHVTDFLPPSGEMIAGAQHADPSQRHREPPSFRPTIHFSLGQMVSPHGRHSWEDKKYGIVLPLRDLEPQLANVSPHDSFIVGNLKLPPGTVVFVPEGSDPPQLPEHIQVQTYQGTLRKAIDAHIQDQDGWQVRMSGVSNDDPAKIGQRDINSPEFFSALLKERPDLSFGSHIASEVGQAFRYGAIEQGLVQFSRSFDPYGIPLSTGDAKFYRAYLDHHLEKLPRASHPSAQLAVDQKVKNLKGHLKVVDLDLKFRKSGFSLSRTSEATRSRAAALSFLGPLALPLLKSQLNLADESKPSIDKMVEALRCLPPDELREFQKKNPELFQDVDLGALHARYAVTRWLHQREDREGLENLLLDGMQHAREPLELMEVLRPALRENSYRRDTALSILRRPVVQANLHQEEGMRFPGGGPRTLREAIEAHPVAREGLTPWQPEAAGASKSDLELLQRLGQVDQLTPDPSTSWSECLNKARAKTSFQESFQRHVAEFDRPMNSLRPYEERMPGDVLGLLELLERDGIAGQPIPKEAWQSPLSLRDYAARFLSKK